MFNLLRRNLLVSTAALFSLTIAPALVSAISAPIGASILSAAMADDDNGGDDNDNGGNDDNGNDDNENGNDDNDNGTDDNDNGADDHGDDDSGADDDSTDDNGVDDNGADDDVDTTGVNADQGRDDRTSLVVTDAQLRGLANGSMVAIDQTGRRLDLEIEKEHNRTAVTINAPRNSVTAVTIVPAH